MRFQLLALFERNLNTALRFALNDKLDVVFFYELLLTAVNLKLLNLLFLGLIVLDLLLELGALISAIL